MLSWYDVVHLLWLALHFSSTDIASSVLACGLLMVREPRCARFQLGYIWEVLAGLKL